MPGFKGLAVPGPTYMPEKRFKPEEIAAKLRQVEVLQSQGMAALNVRR